MTNEETAAGLESVTAYRVWEISADYDGKAPDTAALLVLATRELADEVCACLNEDPRAWGCLAFVDGCEGHKRFVVRQAVTELPGPVLRTREETDQFLADLR